MFVSATCQLKSILEIMNEKPVSQSMDCSLLIKENMIFFVCLFVSGLLWGGGVSPVFFLERNKAKIVKSH